MFRKHFLTSALMSLALVLVVSEAVQAQSLRERRLERRGTRRGQVAFNDTMTQTTAMRSFYYAPEVIPNDQTGRIRVMLPHGNAQVWINENLMTTTGTDRLYYTPALTTGVQTTYRIRATWTHNGQSITQEQVVPVMPGRTLVVTFPTR